MALFKSYMSLCAVAAESISPYTVFKVAMMASTVNMRASLLQIKIKSFTQSTNSKMLPGRQQHSLLLLPTRQQYSKPI